MSEGREAGRDGLVVVLVDDFTIVRRELALLLESRPSVARVETAATAAAPVRAVERHDPDLLIVDFALPEHGRFAGEEQLRGLGVPVFPGVRVDSLAIGEGEWFVRLEHRLSPSACEFDGSRLRHGISCR